MSEKEYCEVTGKVCYSQKEASDTIRIIKNHRKSKRGRFIPKRSYRCQFCGTYHLTHLNNAQTCKSTLRRYGAN